MPGIRISDRSVLPWWFTRADISPNWVWLGQAVGWVQRGKICDPMDLNADQSLEEATDEQLVALYRAGRNEAFETLLGRSSIHQGRQLIAAEDASPLLTYPVS